MFIKICGITNIHDAQIACDLGASALGFVFAESNRQVTARQTAAIVKGVPQHIETVGVFVNEPLENLKTIINKSKITAVQLHGQETNQYISALADIIAECNPIPHSKKESGPRKGIKIIKTLKIGRGHKDHSDQTTTPGNHADRTLQFKQAPGKKGSIWKYLVEPHVKGVDGGSGKGFDWQAIKNLNLADIIVAGGIKPANIHSLLNQIQPFGIDLSSGVEKSPGVKDEFLMKMLFKNILSTG